jgi:CheY-like chemotaxis protein
MPDVSGRVVLDFMKKERIKTPVIVVTAVAAATEIRNELENKYHIDGFVSKTYLSNDLVPEIQKVLAKRK